MRRLATSRPHEFQDEGLLRKSSKCATNYCYNITENNALRAAICEIEVQ